MGKLANLGFAMLFFEFVYVDCRLGIPMIFGTHEAVLSQVCVESSILR